MDIKLAVETDIPLINAVIECSKRFWDYSEEYLKEAIPLIQIDNDWLNKNRGYSIFDDALVGFLGIESFQNTWTLDHLWISPEKIRHGLGSMAIDYLLREAKKEDISDVFLLPDPPAEGFYSKKGAIFTGKVAQSRVTGGPQFKEMVFHI